MPEASHHLTLSYWGLKRSSSTVVQRIVSSSFLPYPIGDWNTSGQSVNCMSETTYLILLGIETNTPERALSRASQSLTLSYWGLKLDTREICVLLNVTLTLSYWGLKLRQNSANAWSISSSYLILLGIETCSHTPKNKVKVHLPYPIGNWNPLFQSFSHS